MKVVMGGLNGIYLRELCDEALAHCDHVQAAVAYAQIQCGFFERCKNSEARLQFYGLLDASIPVSPRVLEFFLQDHSGRMTCRLVNGHFHAKVIWWHGHGAYIGSANLTDKAWYKNIECGLFLSEEELVTHAIEEQLEAMFTCLSQISLPLSRETYEKVSQLSNRRQSTIDPADRSIEFQFVTLFGNQLPHSGLTVVAPKGQKSTRAQEEFIKEWHETLQILRNLSIKFWQTSRRPSWVSTNAIPAVHFDQFLHAYYYDFVRGSDDEGRSVEKVERAHERHKTDLEAAFDEAVSWWADLETAPFGEDRFIAVTAPKMQAELTLEMVRRMDVKSFSQVMRDIHAFRTHARQVQNKTLGLPPEHQEDVDTRADRLANWLWQQTSEGRQSGSDPDLLTLGLFVGISLGTFVRWVMVIKIKDSPL